MNSWKKAGGVILACFALATFAPVEGGETVRFEPPALADLATVVRGANEFGVDLYAQLRDREGNLFFSPLSLSVALAMTRAGAHQLTAEKLDALLHLPHGQALGNPALGSLLRGLRNSARKGAYQLRIANGLWAQEGLPILPEFRHTLRDAYDALLFNVDFRATEEARRKINAWVTEETSGAIHDLLSPGVLDAKTRLVLTNAVYYKGKWVSPFRRELTREGTFHAPGRDVNVPLMHRTGNYGYAEFDAYQLLGLPYEGGGIAMFLLLPKRMDELRAVESELSAEILSEGISRIGSRRVEVTIPRFKVTSEFELKGVLSKMGAAVAFSDQADFSGITGEKGALALSTVVHQGFVDVNEEGTEAAAATGIGASVTAVADPPVVFRADHPFVFMILDRKSGSLLFLGRMVHP
jgi:serpin B